MDRIFTKKIEEKETEKNKKNKRKNECKISLGLWAMYAGTHTS